MISGDCPFKSPHDAGAVPVPVEVLKFRIIQMRILYIKNSVVDPNTLNLDPDPRMKLSILKKNNNNF